MARGWAVLPIPFRSKNPGFKGWRRLRITSEAIGFYFRGRPQNIGVLLGEPSGWLVDIDLDHAMCLELADQHLPPTPAVFGRAGNPRSHRVYRVTGPIATKKFRSKSAGMLVELRSTGMQTVFPPSVHESGEPIEWDVAGAEPAAVEPAALLAAVESLAAAVKVALGEKPPSVRRRAPAARRTIGVPTALEREHAPEHSVDSSDASEACLKAMLRIRVADKRDGSLRLFACACRTVEYGLDSAAALATIREYANHCPFPRNWTDDEILQRVTDAERRCQRGAALGTDVSGCVPLGGRVPDSGKIVLSHKRTLPTAEAYVREFHLHPGGRTLVNHAGVLREWQDGRYVELEVQGIKQRLQAWLHDGLRYARNRATSKPELIDFEANSGSINSALEAIQALTFIPAGTPTPTWLSPPAEYLPPAELLVSPKSLLHLPTMRRYASTPQFFTMSALEFEPDPNAPEPAEWNKFLDQLFESDIESRQLLQEWFGYCLTGDTSQQKMLLIVGPKRSGKGTIARVLARLVGLGNIAGPTTSSLAGPFGLQPLIGRSLAIVSDARFHGEGVATVVERLLCVSGEDPLSIECKHRDSVTMKLPTRFMFLTNELPRLTDASGALAGRFVTLQLAKSFYGREDHQLTDRLISELPGILNWAIAGWHRLRETKRFSSPASVRDVVEAILDLSSPVSAFLRHECIIGPGHRVATSALFEAWKAWCSAEGGLTVGTKQSFGRNLAAALPGLTRRRGTELIPFYDGLRLKNVAK